MSKLEGKIDTIIEMIIQGDSYRIVANYLEVPLSTLHDYTSKSEHSARVREALLYSASTFDDKAEQVLKDAASNSVEVQRARELAQHYRWKASKRAPKQYGDKLDVTTLGEKISTTVIKWGDKEIEI